MREIGLQQSLDRLRRVLGLEVVIDLLPDISMRAKAAAREQMIALDGIDILADVNLGGDQADIADVMLRAGMVAAGQMDIKRRIELDPRLDPVADLGGMKLGVRRCKPTSGIRPPFELRALFPSKTEPLKTVSCGSRRSPP